jgi:hypothetical protein
MSKLLDSIKVPNNSYLLSLTALTGKRIKDIQFYFSQEFESTTIKVSKLILEDGCELEFEGEHDHPYLIHSLGYVPNVDQETLDRLYEEINK